jgi:hypothetical protein
MAHLPIKITEKLKIQTPGQTGLAQGLNESVTTTYSSKIHADGKNAECHFLAHGALNQGRQSRAEIRNVAILRRMPGLPSHLSDADGRSEDFYFFAAP